MNGIWKGCAVVLAAAAMSGGAVIASPVKTMTVGDLAVRLARVAGVRLPADAPEASAAAFLKTRGVLLGEDLHRPVLEMDLVIAGRALGVTVSSSQPASPVSTAQGAAFAGAVRGSLLASEETGSGAPDSASSGGGINVSCQGRDSRAGRKGVPASPADPNATAPPCTDEPTP